MLYRKHRPQSWSDITAQEHITKTLKQEVATNTVAHAILLCGPRGVGKTTTARLLAKSLNCAQRTDAEPCNTCENCTRIAQSQSIDVIEIDAASHTGVDNVRENIIENARFTPTQSPYKIFIIDEVHMLSASSFNALLKTLEEPPPHVRFIMATTELHKIPATVLSRCQRFDFKHIGIDDITQRLAAIARKENITIDEDVLEHVAWRAQGSMRDAESLLSQIIAMAQNNVVTGEAAAAVLPPRNNEHIIAYLRCALGGYAHEALDALHNIIANGTNIAHVADDIIDVLRTLLMIKTTQSFGESYFNARDRETLIQFAEETSIPTILNALDVYMKRRAHIGLSPILHLPLELAAIDCALAAGIKTDPAQPQTTKDKTPLKLTINAETSNISITHNAEEPIDLNVNTEITNMSATTLTIADITEKWPQFLEYLHEFNHSLPFVLKTCTPVQLAGSELTVTLPYEFHQKKIEEPTVKHNIETALKHIYQTDLTIRARVVANGNTDAAEEVVAKVLEKFGGKVVSE